MKLLWKLGKAALRYKALYFASIFSTLALTLINLAAPRLLSDMIGIVQKTPVDMRKIGLLTAVLSAAYLLRVLFRFLSGYLAHKAAWHLVRDLRVQLYAKIQGLSMSFFHDKQTGELMSRVINDTGNFELLYAHILPEMITNTVTVAGVLIVLFSINPALALLTCAPVPLILGGGWLFSRKIRPLFRSAQKAIAAISAKIQDNFSGIREIQSFGRGDSEEARVAVHVDDHTNALLKALKLSGAFHPAVEFFSALGTLIVVGFGGYLASKAQLSVTDIVAFLLYLSLFYGPISGLARLLEDMQSAYAGAERVAAILDTKRDIEDAPDAAPLEHIRGAVEFRNVSFCYKDEIPVLSGISFSCEPGQMIALVGPTGVGKTTITHLVSRFYDPTEGQVLIDGRDLRGVTLDSLRAGIAPVLQDTYLFNGTIEENIAYSRPEATHEEIVAAAAAARIHEFITGMPEGYNTQVGERGLRLSGGQKQRVAIARAILRKAPIIVLDEATASVDTETEKEIQEAIDALSENHTIIAIAHRLSTIRRADLILVLEDGKIVQHGTHDELMATDGLYRRLSLIQG